MSNDESFLHATQLEGQARPSKKNEYMSLNDAMSRVAMIRDEEAIAYFKETPSEDWPTVELKTYCHDCRAIVEPGAGKTLRGNPRKVCGTCKSKKISGGTEKGLKGYYHLNAEGKRE